jgi:hypothetical protein
MYPAIEITLHFGYVCAAPRWYPISLESVSRDLHAAAARRFFTRVLRMLRVAPREVVTDAAPVYPAVLDELLPSAWHHVEQYATAR